MYTKHRRGHSRLCILGYKSVLYISIEYSFLNLDRVPSNVSQKCLKSGYTHFILRCSKHVCQLRRK